MKDRPLTAKQRLFIDWYVSAEVNMNGTEAARRAGYKGCDNQLAVAAYQNLRKPHIKREIDARIGKAAEGADVTVEKVLNDLESERTYAMRNGNVAAAIRASELQGKYLKMFTDRIEQVEAVDEMSTDELLTLMREIAEAGGIDLSTFFAADGAQAGPVSAGAGTSKPH